MQINIKKLIPERKVLFKYILIITGLLVFLFGGMYAATALTSTPEFCKSCHIMQPEYATWQASSHSQISCVECHVDSGLVNEMKHKVVATKELYMYVTKTYELPIRMTEDIPDNRCLKCHSTKRPVSPSYQGLYIPHDKHNKAGVGCIKCHSGVAHGKITEQGLTMGGNFNSWTKAAGYKVMTAKNTSPRMDLCMDCHGRRGVSVSCETCHGGDNMKPETHREVSFKTKHGQLAKKNIQYCNTCHAYIKAPGVTSVDMPQQEDAVAKYLDSLDAGAEANSYANYAKTNEYCVACHKKRPFTHDDNWPIKHGQVAQKNSESCLICHSPRSDVKGTTQTAACASCHPSIHNGIPWRKSHPIEIPQRYTTLEPRCFQCHVKETCIGCHRSSGPETKPVSNKVVGNKPQVTITGGSKDNGNGPILTN